MPSHSSVWCLPARSSSLLLYWFLYPLAGSHICLSPFRRPCRSQTPREKILISVLTVSNEISSFYIIILYKWHEPFTYLSRFSSSFDRSTIMPNVGLEFLFVWCIDRAMDSLWLNALLVNVQKCQNSILEYTTLVQNESYKKPLGRLLYDHQMQGWGFDD